MMKEIEDLMEREELKIEAWEATETEIILFVSELTPENLKLDDTEIKGKKVYVKKIIE